MGALFPQSLCHPWGLPQLPTGGEGLISGIPKKGAIPLMSLQAAGFERQDRAHLMGVFTGRAELPLSGGSQ